MDARKCLEIAKGWLEVARDEDDMAMEGRQLAFAKAWLEAGSALDDLELSLLWREEDERRMAKENKDVDGPAEGEDG